MVSFIRHWLWKYAQTFKDSGSQKAFRLLLSSQLHLTPLCVLLINDMTNSLMIMSCHCYCSLLPVQFKLALTPGSTYAVAKSDVQLLRA